MLCPKNEPNVLKNVCMVDFDLLCVLHVYSECEVQMLDDEVIWSFSTAWIDMRQHSQKLLALSRQRFLLIQRSYPVVWVGSTLSLIGDVLFLTVLTVWIGMLLHTQSYAPLATSGNGGQR
jgi:hypothetical protein